MYPIVWPAAAHGALLSLPFSEEAFNNETS